ncbi:hypothetical protein GCM10009663_35250 [Kitasatospora arboriphila]|uniref:Uncharacterized protein n=1 Tax=Kitasatospora arboriphila TaxID=258052 RepID=A0ABN1TIW4_9ACTN
MENPFRGGGPLDKTVPYCQLALSVALLGDGPSRWRTAAPRSGPCSGPPDGTRLLRDLQAAAVALPSVGRRGPGY